MRNFLQKISSVLSVGGESFDTILHLGAGQDADRSDYEGLQFQKIILVEGDPEAAEVLSATYEGISDVQIISKVVTPSGGDVTFHRYNLTSVNGIFPAGRLTTLYPRLRLIGEEVLHTISLSSFIEGFQIDGDCKNLLILDLPGQEADLIQSLSRDQLRKFRFVVIRGCREAYQEGAKELGQSLSFLKKSHYKLAEQDAEENPQWPIALFEFDGAIAEIEEELEKRAHLLVEKDTQIHQQGERIGELERLFGEVSAQRDGLQGEVAEVTRQRDELKSAHAILNEELENRARLLLEKATQIHQQGERIAELERVLGEVSAQRDALQEELENRARLLVEKETEIQQKSERIEEAERHYGDMTAHRDALSAEREGLFERIAGFESQVQDQLGRQKCIKDQMAKAEAQLEMLKELTRPAIS